MLVVVVELVVVVVVEEGVQHLGLVAGVQYLRLIEGVQYLSLVPGVHYLSLIEGVQYLSLVCGRGFLRAGRRATNVEKYAAVPGRKKVTSSYMSPWKTATPRGAMCRNGSFSPASRTRATPVTAMVTVAVTAMAEVTSAATDVNGKINDRRTT